MWSNGWQRMEVSLQSGFSYTEFGNIRFNAGGNTADDGVLDLVHLFLFPFFVKFFKKVPVVSSKAKFIEFRLVFF